MEPVSRASSLIGTSVPHHMNRDEKSECSRSVAALNLDYNAETQLPNQTKSEDNVDHHLWDSRGRRLFPQRRPSILSSGSPNVNAIPSFHPLQDSAPRDHSFVDSQECNSKASSPHSDGTVNIIRSPSLTGRFQRLTRVLKRGDVSIDHTLPNRSLDLI